MGNPKKAMCVRKIRPDMIKVSSAELVMALQKNNGSQANAARGLGITRQAVRDRIKNDPIVRTAWERYVFSLEKVVPDKKSIRVISEAMNATKEHRNMSGEVVDRSPDHLTRLKANEQYLKIKGLVKDENSVTKNTQVNTYNFKDARTEDLVRSIDEIIAERVRRKRIEEQGVVSNA